MFRSIDVWMRRDCIVLLVISMKLNFSDRETFNIELTTYIPYPLLSPLFSNPSSLFSVVRLATLNFEL